MDQARLRALHNPDHKSKRRDENDGWDEVGGYFVRKALYGRPAPLGFPDHAHNLGQQGRAAYTLSPHEKRPGAIQRAARDLAFRRFFQGVGLTRDHGLIHIARPLDHPPIHGDFLTRPDPQDIARLDAIEWDILLGPTLAPQPRLLWGQPNQCLQGACCPAARAQLEDLAEEDQGRNGCGGFKIDGHFAVWPAIGDREETREKRSEEHTSELQSPCNLVCRLLLEKKK